MVGEDGGRLLKRDKTGYRRGYGCGRLAWALRVSEWVGGGGDLLGRIGMKGGLSIAGWS